MTTPSQVRAYLSRIGKKAAGKPKKFSAEELEKRVARLQRFNARYAEQRRKRREEKQRQKMREKLKLWNFWDRGVGRYYVGAYSLSHAVRLFEQAGLRGFTRYYLNEMASPGAWGNDMKHITPDVGLWYLKTGTKEPVKLA
jgi:hypothetical protein